jgi:hypothetical protein
VHCSLWTYRGDSNDLSARYEAMIAEIPPEAMQFAACVVAAFAGGRRVES